MAYAIAAVLVVLLVGGFVMFMVLNATSKSGPNPQGDDEAPGIGADESPLGDTTQHAGTQNREGETTDDPEQDDFRRVDPDRAADEAAHVARPGEGEGAEQISFEGVRPERRGDA
jgi:hypothetical protein